MEGHIQPIPIDRIVPHASSRESARQRDQQRDSKPFELAPPPAESAAEETKAPTEVHEAHPPCEDGVGLRLDITA